MTKIPAGGKIQFAKWRAVSFVVEPALRGDEEFEYLRADQVFWLSAGVSVRPERSGRLNFVEFFTLALRSSLVNP